MEHDRPEQVYSRTETRLRLSVGPQSEERFALVRGSLCFRVHPDGDQSTLLGIYLASMLFNHPPCNNTSTLGSTADV